MADPERMSWRLLLDAGDGIENSLGSAIPRSFIRPIIDPRFDRILMIDA